VQVLNVSHNRLDATLPINEVDVFIELETRGSPFNAPFTLLVAHARRFFCRPGSF
jgi:hypothetical protein